jgi:hypothetical protein
MGASAKRAGVAEMAVGASASVRADIEVDTDGFVAESFVDPLSILGYETLGLALVFAVEVESSA